MGHLRRRPDGRIVNSWFKNASRLRVGLLLHNWTLTFVKTGTSGYRDKGNPDMGLLEWSSHREKWKPMCIQSGDEMKDSPHEHTCMCGNAHSMNILVCAEMLTAWTYLHLWKCSPHEHTCMCGNAHLMNIFACVEMLTAWTYLHVWKYSPHEQNWRRREHRGENWSVVTTRPFWILDY